MVSQMWPEFSILLAVEIVITIFRMDITKYQQRPSCLRKPPNDCLTEVKRLIVVIELVGGHRGLVHYSYQNKRANVDLPEAVSNTSNAFFVVFHTPFGLKHHFQKPEDKSHRA